MEGRCGRRWGGGEVSEEVGWEEGECVRRWSGQIKFGLFSHPIFQPSLI